MPFPRGLAKFNRLATNRVGRVAVPWLPGFVTVVHAGRRSGKSYRTPVCAFRRGDTLTIALTYGKDSEWTKNVLAAGGCTAESGRARLVLTAPRLVHDEKRRAVPPPVRLVLGLLGVADFLELTILPGEGDAGNGGE